MKKYIKKIFFSATITIIVVVGVSVLPSITKADTFSSRLSGRILLSVESNGETWYVNPLNLKRYFIGDSLDALHIMQQLGLGISNRDFDSFNGTAPARLSGFILIKVEDQGKAYYVNPVNNKAYFLGNPDQALRVLQGFGLGITNNNIDKLLVSEKFNISINTSGFSPNNITVNRGAMITWTNYTNSIQTVTSPNNFNFGDIAAGRTYSRMFNSVGTYYYHSNNNQSMTGVIVVQ
jgi:plastocyanin